MVDNTSDLTQYINKTEESCGCENNFTHIRSPSKCVVNLLTSLYLSNTYMNLGILKLNYIKCCRLAVGHSNEV